MSWLTDFEAKFGISPPPAPWKPTYQPQQYVTVQMNSGTSIQVPINEEYLVDLATAEHLQAIYNPNGKVEADSFEGATGGPDTSTAVIYDLVWPNGVKIMAGFLANYFVQDSDPADADKDARAAIAAAGAA